MKVTYVLFLFLLITARLSGQILPAEGSSLNYRLIGFSFPSQPDVSNYKIEIAQGNYATKGSFEKNIIEKENCKTNKIILEVPSFGKEYTWRVVYNGAPTGDNSLHHFRTKIIPDVADYGSRLRILKKAEKYENAYVFVDGNNALYDMSGRPVWFPYIKGLDSVQSLRDMKLSPRGTITFVLGDQAFEINYGGDILWRGPNNGTVSGDGSEHYHHQLSRLKNGHYMVLGNEYALCKFPDSTDKNMHIVENENFKLENYSMDYMKINMGTVIEYDEKGNVAWYWKSSKYFYGSDVENYRNPDAKDPFNIDVHANAFFLDEKNKTIYISYKNINRIIKVKYPEGDVLRSYGEIYQPGAAAVGTELFHGQHDCFNSESGSLILYNNNSANRAFAPKIIALQEPATAEGGLKTIWEYQCTTEDTSDVAKMKYNWNTGGNVIELPGQMLFACMGGTYSKVFIIDANKEVQWSALPEKWSVAEKAWLPATGYRASIMTSRKEIEALVWNEEIKE